MEEVFARATDGVAAAVVTGDPGSGKTRLLAKYVERIGVDDPPRIVGYQPEQGVPLSASADLLRLLAASPVGRQLRALVFEAETAGQEPIRIFEAAHRVVDAVEPLLLVVDDLQWVDELSVALCHYLVRAGSTSGQRLRLIAASRPSAQTSAFVASLAQVLPVDRLVRRTLGPLSVDESLELIKALAPELPPARAHAVSARSGGSPFWLEALVRTSGAGLDAAQLVTDRLRGAGADPGTLLALLAVAARPLAVADAAKLEGWTIKRTEYAVAELVSRGVAVHTTGGVRLAHDVIRDAAFRDLTEETRRDVHRRLAGWLEALAGDDLRLLGEALGHRHAAGLPSLELAGRLARAPRRTLLGEEGLALLTRIVDEAAGNDERALASNEDVASLASELANHRIALRHWSQAAERATEPLRRGTALLAASRAALALDDAETARAYLDRSRGVGVDDEVLALDQAAQEAVMGLWSGNERVPGQTRAHEVARRAQRMVNNARGVEALDARSRRAYLEALRVGYEASYQEDDVEGLLRTSEESAAAARGFDEGAYLQASIANGRALRRAARLGESEQRLRHAWEEAHRQVLPQLTIDAAYWLGTVLEQQGCIGEAEDVVTEAIDLAARVGDEARGRHRISRLGPKIAFHRGPWRRAIAELLEEGRESSPHGLVEYHQDAAIWFALAGGSDLEREVVTQLEEALRCVEAAGCRRCRTELRLVAAEALARVGRGEEAARSLAEWERLQERPQARDLLLQRRVRGLLSDRDGNGATSLLEYAIGEADGLGLVLDALWTRIDLGRTLATRERERAVEVLRGATETATEIGALTERQVAEQSLRALGVRTWRRGSAAEQLTEREREIARLVAGGASNPEIAQALFVSRKTVERHVSNLLNKVGVRNRVELAAKWANLEVEGVPR